MPVFIECRSACESAQTHNAAKHIRLEMSNSAKSSSIMVYLTRSRADKTMLAAVARQAVWPSCDFVACRRESHQFESVNLHDLIVPREIGNHAVSHGKRIYRTQKMNLLSKIRLASLKTVCAAPSHTYT
jgi:hypothetical protein